MRGPGGSLGKHMHSFNSLLSGYLQIKPAGEEASVEPAPEGELQGKRASHSVALPYAGQGTISVEVAHFARPPKDYAIKLLDEAGRELFRITVEDHRVSIRCQDGSSNAAPSETPLLSFQASSMFIWVSVDRDNRRVSFGQGYMMKCTRIVALDLPERASTEPSRAGKPGTDSLVSDVHSVVFDRAIPFYQERAARVNPSPVVLEIPTAVLDRDAITLEDISANIRLAASELPASAGVLWGTVSGSSITVSNRDAAAIDYSLTTPGMTLYEIVKHKREHDEFGDKNMVYVRVTLGPPEGDSPGSPYVMEIWPIGCCSPVHNHGNTMAIIKVLHGSIAVSWYGPLADRDNPKPSPIMKEETFHAGDVTWLSPENYQTHKLRNPLTTTACITIQSYRYPADDRVHHEFFDYVKPDGGNLQFFEPDSDINYLRMLEVVRKEYAAAGPGLVTG